MSSEHQRSARQFRWQSARINLRFLRANPAATQKFRTLLDALHERLAVAVPGLVLNGHPTERLPNTLHISFPGGLLLRLVRRAIPVLAQWAAYLRRRGAMRIGRVVQSGFR